MLFEWDEPKRQVLLLRRGVDILQVARIFRGPILTEIDSRQDYGETRYRAIGRVENEYYVVVYTAREGVVRLITCWRAGRTARHRYQARHP